MDLVEMGKLKIFTQPGEKEEKDILEISHEKLK